MKLLTIYFVFEANHRGLIYENVYIQQKQKKYGNFNDCTSIFLCVGSLKVIEKIYDCINKYSILLGIFSLCFNQLKKCI